MSRQYSFYVEILSKDEELKGRMGESVKGNLYYNQASTVHSGGQIHAETKENQKININPQQDRVRVYFDDTGETTLMGTYLIAAPDEQFRMGVTGPRSIIDFVLLDKITILDEYKFAGAYSAAKGANTVEVVRSIIMTATGEPSSRIISTASTRVLREARVWDVGSSALQIINDLLSGIDYWGIRCDPMGRFLVQPYVLPENRPLTHIFTDNNTSTHSGEWTRSRDISAVPNRFIVFSSGTEEDKGYVGVASNTDAGSPFSYQSRGRWIVETESVTELASQAEADKLAQRRLNDASSPVSNIEITHAFKKFNLHDKLQLQWYDQRVTATVYTMSLNLGTPGLMTTGLRELL